MAARTLLLIGTHKGGFLYTSDQHRSSWDLSEPFFKGIDVNHLTCDLRSQPTLLACVNNMWWGPSIRYSLDFGETWQEPETDIRFEEGSEREVKRVWCVVAAPATDGKRLYAGVDPAALFVSDDRGLHWSEVKALANHPTREKWAPGAGGMMVHSICFDESHSDWIQVGISAAGTFVTKDGGKSWSPGNVGVRADFLPEKFPEVGQCVHHMTTSGAPGLLYQQNHDGVYRSQDWGETWTDITTGLPSRFGFPLQVHPADPNTIYVIPEEGAEFRCPPNAELAVYRSRDRGDSWEKLTNGLPSNAYLQIYRQAMCADTHDSPGIYFGTSTGQIFASTDGGERWEMIADFLPPIYSLESFVLD